MGALKPYLTSFVEKGILALKTPEMKACIQNSFAVDGCFRQMRSPEMQLAAGIARALEEAHVEENVAIIENVELAEFVEELAAVSGTDTDSDSDNE